MRAESLSAAGLFHRVPRGARSEQAGCVFARTRPRLAVYSHAIHVTSTDDDLIPGTRRECSGRLEIGVDRMVITIGDSIDMKRPGSRGNEPKP